MDASCAMRWLPTTLHHGIFRRDRAHGCNAPSEPFAQVRGELWTGMSRLLRPDTPAAEARRCLSTQTCTPSVDARPPQQDKTRCKCSSRTRPTRARIPSARPSSVSRARCTVAAFYGEPYASDSRLARTHKTGEHHGRVAEHLQWRHSDGEVGPDHVGNDNERRNGERTDEHRDRFDHIRCARRRRAQRHIPIGFPSWKRSNWHVLPVIVNVTCGFEKMSTLAASSTAAQTCRTRHASLNRSIRSERSLHSIDKRGRTIDDFILQLGGATSLVSLPTPL